MKKAYFKDSIKMFKNNSFRFISIVLIIMLGTAFFIGMNAISPAMRETAEDYMKSRNIFDIALISNFGYKQEDIDRIKENDKVEEVQGIYEYDALAKFEEKDIVVRFSSQNNDIEMNKNDIYEGQNIQNDNECLISSKLCDMYGYDIGDIIKIYRQDDSKVEDNLEFSEFEIVGKIRNPMYLSKFYGNTTLLTGELNGHITVKESVFKMEDYTKVYVKTNIDKDLDRFSDEYEEKLEEILPSIKEINTQIAKEKYEKIYKESSENLSKGETVVEDAQRYLDEGYKQIKDSQLQINFQITAISNTVSKYYNTNMLYKKIEEKNKKIKELYSSLDGLESKNKGLEKENLELKPQIITLKDELEELENNIDKNLYEVYSLTDEESKFVELSKKSNNLYFEHNKKQEEYERINEEYEQKKKELEDNEQSILQTKEQINTLQQDLYNSFSSIQDLIAGMNNAELSKNVDLVIQAKEMLDANQKELREENLEEKIAKYKEKITEKKDELNQFKAIAEETPLYKNSGFKSLKDDLEKIGIMGKIFPVMFFVVATLVTITTITRMIEEDRKNIGILKALGYSKRKIMSRYIVYSFILAIMGDFLGAIVGSTIIVKVLFVSYCSLYDLPDLISSINIIYIVISLVISLISTVFVTVIITTKSLSEKTANLMRPKAGKEGKSILLEKIPFLWKKFNFLTKICFRNIFRHKKRLLMTLVGIAGCTALIYAGFGVQSAINSIASKQFRDIKKLSLEVYLQKEMNNDEIDEVEEYIRNQNNVKDLTPVRQQTLTIEVDDNTKDIFYIVVDGNEAEKYIGIQDRKSQEKLEFNDDGVIITEKLAEKFDIKKGDKIKITDDGSNATLKVIGITENYLYNYIYMTPKIYERIHGTSIKYNGLFVNMEDEISEEDKVSLANKLKENDKIASTLIESNWEEEFLTSLNSLMTVVILFVGCASLLSFTVLINLNNINIEERTRELATIKLLGFYKKELESYVFRENIVLTLFGTILGLGLGMGILGIIIKSAEVETIFLPKDINLVNLAIATIITILFTLITNLFMKKKLKNINMIDSLKSIE